MVSDVLDPARSIQRCVRLQQHIALLKLQANKSDGEQEAVTRLLREAADLISEAMQRKNDAPSLLRLEQDRLRALAVDLRSYELRNHLMYARPTWGPKATTRPNRFSLFGEVDALMAARNAAESLGLELLEEEAAGRAPDRSRWETIGASNFAIFDMRSAAFDSGTWPSTCHALGLALGVSTGSIVVTDAGATLPFDIHINPLRVGGKESLEHVLGGAMGEAATAIPPASERGSSTEATVSHVLDELHQNARVMQYLRPLIEPLRANVHDPVKTRLYLESLLGQAPSGGGTLLTPAWPGAYPDRRHPSCFHILPFALPDAISLAVEDGCGSSVRYVRGDTSGSIDVIEGIWEGIAEASAVVVDLTPAPASTDRSLLDSPRPVPPNANVCLELALAQVLGRRLLLVRDAREPFPELFPQIAKLQVRLYRSPRELSDLVRRFVTQESEAQ